MCNVKVKALKSLKHSLYGKKSSNWRTYWSQDLIQSYVNQLCGIGGWTNPNQTYKGAGVVAQRIKLLLCGAHVSYQFQSACNPVSCRLCKRQELGFLPCSWEIWMEFLDVGSVLTQQEFGQWIRSPLSLSLPLTFSPLAPSQSLSNEPIDSHIYDFWHK